MLHRSFHRSLLILLSPSMGFMVLISDKQVSGIQMAQARWAQRPLVVGFMAPSVTGQREQGGRIRSPWAKPLNMPVVFHSQSIYISGHEPVQCTLRWQNDFRCSFLVVFKRPTCQHARIFINGECSDLTSNELMVSDVDKIMIINKNSRQIDAQTSKWSHSMQPSMLLSSHQETDVLHQYSP